MNANHLPEHIGKSFTVELACLIDYLALTHGFKGRYLKSEYLSKYCDQSTTPSDVRSAAAISKWLRAEENNRKTNHRILFGEDFGWATSDELREFARAIIKGVLGPIERLDGIRSNHTNGASTRIRRSPTAAISKYSGIAHGTAPALLQWSLGVSNTLLEDQRVECVQGSSVFTVPKKSDIDRVACKEPEINLFLQRAVGDHIRGRLKRFGIDLNDQSVNQELARTAVSNGLATIDLSSASDSISKQLVFELLPFEWWTYLDSIRSHYTKVNEEWVELEMFSSMGNGFTFELESLIFWALTRAVCRFSGVKGVVKVYGDDIIAPSQIFRRLKAYFHWVGFTINPAKSAFTGLFRESCGKHYHGSLDVSPFYIRGPVRSKTDLIRLLNRLVEWDSRGVGFITDDRIADFYIKWRSAVPSSLWGGQDPDDITSLVTGHSPRKRLVQKVRKLDFDPEHALIHWHTTRRISSTLEIDVCEQAGWTMSDQPDHLVRSTWKPLLAYADYADSDMSRIGSYIK